MTENQQRYCNAYVTHCSCSGHVKAARNEQLMKHWADVIAEEGSDVPPDDVASKHGVFNGEGSS